MLYQIVLFSGQIRYAFQLHESAIGNPGLLRRLAPVFKAGAIRNFHSNESLEKLPA